MRAPDVAAPASEQPGEARMVAQLWPLLAAASLGLVPFTVFSTFLVDLAHAAGSDIAVLGGLRGLGGVAALITGVVAAPLLDRLSRVSVAAVSLVAIAVACLAAVTGSVWSWVLFCLLIGAATSTLNPAVSALAADRYRDDATSARAATMVSATMTLTAVLAAPVLALPALLWGWRGDLVAVALVALVAAVALPRLLASTGGDVAARGGRPGYAEALRTAVGVPGALPMILVSTARTTAFMGQLAYLAAFYSERFGVGPGWFALVWSLSGLAFFLGNWSTGRVLRGEPRTPAVARAAVAGAVVAALAIGVLFAAPSGVAGLVLACAMTAVLAASHAVIAACVTTVLVRRSGGVRGTVLSLHGSAQSVGVFLGAALAGGGLVLGRLAGAEWLGVGLVLGVVTLLGVPFALWVARQAEPDAG